MRGENLRFFPELRHRVAKMLRVLAYDSGGAALPELLRPGAPTTAGHSHCSRHCGTWLITELKRHCRSSRHHIDTSSDVTSKHLDYGHHLAMASLALVQGSSAGLAGNRSGF